jgi:streptomycin 6-kinase
MRSASTGAKSSGEREASTRLQRVGARLDEHARAWHVAVEHVVETESSLIGFGRRKSQAVVLKVLKRPGDEWRSGEVVRAFHGHGVVRVYECVDGALLLECLTPGHSLVHMTLDGRDDDATAIIADVIQQMAEPEALIGCQTVHDWGKAFATRRAADGPFRRLS